MFLLNVACYVPPLFDGAKKIYITLSYLLTAMKFRIPTYHEFDI